MLKPWESFFPLILLIPFITLIIFSYCKRYQYYIKSYLLLPLFFLEKNHSIVFPGKLYFWREVGRYMREMGRKEEITKAKIPILSCCFFLASLLWFLLFWLRKGGWITWALKELFNCIKYSRGYFMASWRFGLLLRSRCPRHKTQAITEFGSSVKTDNFK